MRKGRGLLAALDICTGFHDVSKTTPIVGARWPCAALLRRLLRTERKSRLLVLHIAAFQAQYPAVRVVMAVTDRMVDVVDEGLDVTIRIGQLEDSSLIARKVGEGRRMVCARPSYLKQAIRLRQPKDLSDHACLTFRTHPDSNSWRFRDGWAVIEVRATGPFFAYNGETLVAATCAELGLILAPEWLVGEEISRGRLVQVLADYSPDPATTPLFAVYPPGPYTAPKVRVFVDFLAGRFSGDNSWQEQH